MSVLCAVATFLLLSDLASEVLSRALAQSLALLLVVGWCVSAVLLVRAATRPPSSLGDDQSADFDSSSVMAEIAGQIAHDINQPLAAISNTAGTCAFQLSSDQEVTTDHLVNIFGQIEEQACRAGETVHSLKRVLGEDAGEFEKLDLYRMLMDLVVTSSSVVVDSSGMGDNDLVVWGQRVRIRELIGHLVGAGVAKRTHGPTSVKLSCDKEYAIVAIDRAMDVLHDSEDIGMLAEDGAEQSGGTKLHACQLVVKRHSGILTESNGAHGFKTVLHLPRIESDE